MSEIKIPFAQPVLGNEEATNLQRCIETNFVSSVGPFVSEFETLVAKATGAKACLATASGTSGLHLALLAVGVQPEELVIMPAYTFVASANAISHCGAVPWLLDVDRESWTLDCIQLRTTLEEQTKRQDGALVHKPSGRRVAAIMPVYALGLPADMDAINEIAADFELKIVADAAAAHGALYKKRPIGKLGADLSVLSFNGNKTITSGGGGCIIANNEGIIESARHVASTARSSEEYDHDAVGFNYRMTNLEAAIGCAQMEKLDKLVSAKKNVRRVYDEAFSNLSGISAFPNPEWAENPCWLSGFVFEKHAVKFIAEPLRSIRQRGIDARPFWKPMHLQKPYQSAPRTDMNFTDSFWNKVITLPCSADLSENDQSLVIDAVKLALA